MAIITALKGKDKGIYMKNKKLKLKKYIYIVLLDYSTCLNNFSSDNVSWVIRTCGIYIYILLTRGLVIYFLNLSLATNY